MLEHKHIIVRAEVANPPSDPAYIKEWLARVVHAVGMKLAVGLEANPISYYCNLEGNEGLTGAAILETSHCAIHVWDKDDPAIVQFDLYSCSAIDINVIFDHLSEFNPSKVEYKFIDRENGLTMIEEGEERIETIVETSSFGILSGVTEIH